MDPIVLIIIVVIGLPLGVVWALVKTARMRGPQMRPESRRPVESLVTEAVPDERRPSGEHEGVDAAAQPYVIDSDTPEPEREPGRRSDER